MTKAQRISLNVIATYGRSIFSLVCGLFSSRWVLMALGQTDFGLYATVGSLMSIVTFLNGMFSGSIGRFYAYSVGEAQIKGREAEGLEKCRQWFNTAVLLHIITPTVLSLVGYPIGEWAVRHWLTIPSDRIEDCVWVFRYSMFACFLGVVNVPFNAMYVAKQKIAELTIYSVFSTIANVAILGYMVTHPGVWLTRYAFAMCLVGIVPQMLIVVRALRVFPECRFNRVYMISKERTLKMLNFTWWTYVGITGYMLRTQGLCLLVNKMFGPIYNGTSGVAQSVSGHANALSAALRTAFAPAIANEAGAGDFRRVVTLSLQTSKFGMLLSAVFALPLMTEIDSILKLWLSNPPPFAVEATWLGLLGLVLGQSIGGIDQIVHAYGRIAIYNVVSGLVGGAFLPVGFVLVKCRVFGFVELFALLTAWNFVFGFVSACVAHFVVGFPVRYWLFGILGRSVVAMVFPVLVGVGVRFILSDYFWLRIFMSSGMTFLVYAFVAWRFLLDDKERHGCLQGLIIVKEKFLQACIRNGEIHA